MPSLRPSACRVGALAPRVQLSLKAACSPPLLARAPATAAHLRLAGAYRCCSSDSGGKAETAPKVAALVEQISQLSLLEAAELTEALKERLGITAAVMMPQGGGGGGGGAAPAEEKAAAQEKTHFTVKLESFDAGTKIKLIKEVRSYTGLGLKEAKELVEKAPADVAVDVAKADAEALKAKLEEMGGTIALV